MLFLKERLTCIGRFGFLPKTVKRCLGLAFEANFLHDFPKKCSLCNTLSIDRVSMSYFCLSQDIKQKVLLSSYLENR